MNIKYISLSILITLTIGSCKKTEKTPKIIRNQKATIKNVINFKGQQVTGVTVSNTGRIFANFPRWRNGVKNSVIEIKNGIPLAFPNKQWNNWENGKQLSDSIFIAIQSVVAFEDNIYILDTRNPLFKGVIDNPRIFVFNLKTNSLKKTYKLSKKSFHKDSYINDLRIDKTNQKMYLTDSGHAGIVIIDLQSGMNKRVLDNHPSTSSEQNFLTFKNKKWNNSVHSDGIAFDSNSKTLYFHALTGYHLYAISTNLLINGSKEEIEKGVIKVAKTSAPDGMIFHNDFLYLADLENDKIIKLNLKTKTSTVFAEGKKVKWADTFSIYNNELYYTNSRINETTNNISNSLFSINKINLK